MKNTTIIELGKMVGIALLVALVFLIFLNLTKDIEEPEPKYPPGTIIASIPVREDNIQNCTISFKEKLCHAWTCDEVITCLDNRTFYSKNTMKVSNWDMDYAPQKTNIYISVLGRPYLMWNEETGKDSSCSLRHSNCTITESYPCEVGEPNTYLK